MLGGSKCDSEYLVYPDGPTSIVDNEDLLIIVGKNCACASSQIYVRGYFVPKGLDFHVGKWSHPDLNGDPEDLKDDKELYFPAEKYTNEVIGQWTDKSGVVKVARKTTGALLGNLGLATDSIDEFAALSNALPLEPPMMYMVYLGTDGKHVNVGTGCVLTNADADEWHCDSGHDSIIEIGKGGSVTDICKKLGA